jgi:hypothetical protein
MKGQVRLEISVRGRSVSFVFRLNDLKFAMNYREAILPHDTANREWIYRGDCILMYCYRRDCILMYCYRRDCILTYCYRRDCILT